MYLRKSPKTISYRKRYRWCCSLCALRGFSKQNIWRHRIISAAASELTNSKVATILAVIEEDDNPIIVIADTKKID